MCIYTYAQIYYIRHAARGERARLHAPLGVPSDSRDGDRGPAYIIAYICICIMCIYKYAQIYDIRHAARGERARLRAPLGAVGLARWG